MVPQGNFDLINGLHDNFAILDHTLNPVFQGTLLRNLLLENHIDLSGVNSSSPQDKTQLEILIQSAHSSKKSGLPVSMQFHGIPDTFIIFPMNDENFCFGKKDKLIKILNIEHDLQERLKELECLYSLSGESNNVQDIDEFFTKCLSIIKKAFQHPEASIVNIIIESKVYGSPVLLMQDIKKILTSEIFIDSKKKGEIKVFLTIDSDFLDEEKRLVQEFANRFSAILEKRAEDLNMAKQKKILTAKNEALFRITEECHQKREQLKTFIHAIADKIIVIDREFNVLMSNKDEIIEGQKCYSKLFNADERCVDCPALNTFANSNDSSIEKKVNDRYFTLNAHPIFAEDGTVDKVLEVCRDITDRKRMELQMFQSYKLASLGKLVAGVAHEINNPNTFILGNLKIVQEAFDDIFPILEEQHAINNKLKIARLDYRVFRENISVLVKDMVNGANRTKKIVEDLRNFAKKEEEELNDNIDLNDIIKNNLTLTKKHIKKYAQLDIELNERIPVFKGNLNKIEQVLLNLTMNASEAVQNGNGIIKIKTAYDENTKEILLFISDNGCGIDEAVIKNIFDPFFTTKRNKGGIGLGLSITYGIVKEHGGTIEVESKSGYGTTFTIKFPEKRGS